MPIAAAWELVTEVEPEWDDDQRTMAQALEVYEAGIGPCGFHHSLTNDLDNHFTVETDHCNVCAAQALHARVLAKQDQKTMDRFGDDPSPSLPRPTDGRRIIWRMLGALETMARQVKRD